MKPAVTDWPVLIGPLVWIPETPALAMISTGYSFGGEVHSFSSSVLQPAIRVAVIVISINFFIRQGFCCLLIVLKRTVIIKQIYFCGYNNIDWEMFGHLNSLTWKIFPRFPLLSVSSQNGIFR